ncbi:MAG: nickel pincer cofactor biosynthesis protein LarC [Eubacterium sp.]|nr:nickel pincer cofactor biosynthesis protein LarC [Eubacterium sp.]
MKILYLECNMGIAGDMLMSALLELHPHKEKFMGRFGRIGIPKVTAEAQSVQKCGITGTHISIKIDGTEEVSQDCHAHGHHHTHEEHSHVHGEHGHVHEEHSHSHHSMADIFEIIDRLSLSEKVKSDVKQVYGLIAEAESRVHGKTVEEIHFHEVGMTDAIADICGCCMLMDEISPDKIMCSAVNTGYGQVRCAHGTVPVPAPATALLLQGIPVYAGEVQGELTTPTGAALLKYFVEEYGAMPVIGIEKIGYGMGQKDFAAANCVRAIFGETFDSEETFDSGEVFESISGEQKVQAQKPGTEQAEVVEFICSIDDMTAEEIAFAMERLLESGALEAYASPITMKKSRPALELTVLAAKEDREKIVQKIFRYTTTIGFRERICRRRVLSRRIIEKDTACGKVRYKESSGYGVRRTKAEFDDLKRIAVEQDCSIAQARQKAETE